MKPPIRVRDVQVRHAAAQRRSIGLEGVRPQFLCDAGCSIAEVACNAACDVITDGLLAGACYVGCAAAGSVCHDGC